MKVYEKLMEIQGVYSENATKTKEEIIRQAFSTRTFVSDLLYDDSYLLLFTTIEWFLSNDLNFDGEGISEWQRFLETDVIGG